MILFIYFDKNIFIINDCKELHFFVHNFIYMTLQSSHGIE